MLIQRAGSGTLPPPGFTVPPWALLSRQWDSIPSPETPFVILGPSLLTMGHEDSEADDFSQALGRPVGNHEFGWDNESPERRVEVAQFRSEWRPISNAEFKDFLEKGGKGIVSFPKSWIEEDGKIKVRTLCSAFLLIQDNLLGSDYVWPRPNGFREALASTDLVRRPRGLRGFQRWSTAH